MPHVFDTLTPDRVLDCIEGALGCRCSGICRPRASYINRVFEVGLADGSFLIAKFYRPNRWSPEGLQDELDFVAELADEELPVVPPIPGHDGALLHQTGPVSFAVFPRRGGRPLEDVSPDDWRQLGRLLARMHTVGARRLPRDRVTLGPETSLAGNLRFLLDSGLVAGRQREEYRSVVERIVGRIVPLFEGVPVQRIHGDCHHGNILHRAGEPFHLIDFDDFAVGPAVQDIWMLLPAHPRDCTAELDALAEGYEAFRPFVWEQLRLVEALRAMRYVHYAAWCGRQQLDQGFVQLVPDWGTTDYWQREVELLSGQYDELTADHRGHA